MRGRIRAVAGERCGYCLTPQRLIWGKLEIEHIVPRGLGGLTEELNLWLACSECNSFKQARVEARNPSSGDLSPLFNPRTQVWQQHFRWSVDGTRIEGLTPIGLATVDALRFNQPHLVLLRKVWIAAGLWRPNDDFAD
jgi:hypothetical protein